MANLYFHHSSAPLRTIQEIQFGLLSPEEIKNMSVVHVEYPETMVGERSFHFTSLGWERACTDTTSHLGRAKTETQRARTE